MKKTHTISRIFSTSLLMLFFTSSILHAQSSGTFTIDPTGGGDHLTLQDAVDDLASGGMSGPVTLQFTSGTHAVDEVVVGYVDGMSADNTLTIRSESGSAEDVTLEGDGAYVIRIEGTAGDPVEHVTLEHLTIRNTDGFTVVEVQGVVAGIRIADNRLFGLPTTLNQETRSLIRAYDLAGEGLYIKRNVMEDNSRGIHAQSASSGNPFRDLHIDGNRIGNVHSGNILQNIESAQFVNNRVQVNNREVLQLNSPRGNETLVANNVLVSDGSTVVETIGAPVQPVRFYHNTMVARGGGVTSEVLRVTQTAHDIRNNIIFSAGPGRAIYDNNTGSHWSHNNIYTTGPYLGQFSSSNNPENIGFTLADLVEKTGRHQNSFGVFPALDPEDDYRSNSPFLDQSGDNLSSIISTDIDGNPRSSTPSIGAFEYGSTVTPLSGTYTVGSGGNFSTPAAMIDALHEHGIEDDVTFEILTGTYAVGRALHVVPPATGEERVTIRSQSGNPDDVVFEGVADVEHVLDLNGARFVTIENITLDARDLTTAVRHALGLNYGVSDITIRGNRIIGEESAPNANRSLIRGSDVRQKNYLFEANEFEGGYYALRLNTHSGGSLHAENLIFRQNRVASLGGIFVQSIGDVQIEKNFFQADRAVRVDHMNRTLQAQDAGMRALIANNQIASRTIGGNLAYGFWVRASEAVDVLHNTVRIVKNTASEGVVDINNSAGIDFANNIIVVETSTASNPVYRISGGTSDLQSDHNHFFGLMDNKFRDGSINYTTLEDFQAAAGYDISSSFGEVAFVSDDELVPAGASANDPDLFGTGQFLSLVPDDINGLLRSDPPNKGAHEVDGEQPNFPPFFTSVPDDQSILETDTFQFQFEAEDPDGDPLAFTLTEGDDVANASISSDGLFTFSPVVGQAGNYAFTVRVSDGELHAETSFTVNVNTEQNNPPEFTAVAGDTAIETGSTFTFQFEATDPDGDELTFSLFEGGDVQNASLSEIGLFTFAPEAGQAGAYSFTVQVTDGDLHADASFTITVTEPEPEPPFFTSVPEDASIEKGESFSFQFEAESPDELPLTFQLFVGADTENVSLTDDGLFTFAPEEGQAGVYSFTVRVTDGELHADASFSITVPIGPLVRIYVNADGGSDQNSGNSWENAVSTLYHALQILEEGVTEEIWIAAGTYKPAPAFPAYFDTFQLVSGVAIYGGFIGNEDDLNARNWLENKTIFSCDLNDSGDFEGNCFNVVTGSGTDETAVLDGFIITGGQAIAEIDPLETNKYHRGGGLHNTAGSPTISNIIFKNNRGIEGGAVFNGFGSSPTFKNVHFIENDAEWGGAMFNHTESSPTLINVLFSQNEAEFSAGAMYNLENCSPLIINAVFDRNQAEDWGGAMLNFTDSNPILVNVTFSRNRSFTMGGAILNNHGSEPSFINSIFWDNKGWTGANEIHNTSTAGDPFIAHSLIEGGIDGPGINGSVVDLGGNISNDPWLVDPENGNLRLTGGSPAIGSGTLEPFLTGRPGESIDTDLDGFPRFIDDTISMGAYEWRWNGGSVVYVDQSATGTSNGEEWGSAFNSLQPALRTAEALGPEVIGQIWAAAGTYTPTSDPLDREASFHLVSGAAVFGGFSGSETSLNERDWTQNETILSGNIDDSDNTAWNSFSVVDASGTDETAVLDGFTITGGNSDISSDFLLGPTRSGGGIFNDSGSPTLANLIVKDNHVDYGGGGMANINSSSPSLTNVVFRNNTANQAGGMINRENSSPTLINVRFENNTANSGGGLLTAVNSNPLVVNSVFLNNTALTAGGGGAHIRQNSSPVFINCTFYGNLTNGAGGGLQSRGEESVPELINVIFWGNESTLTGSLTQIQNIEESGLPVLQNNLIQGGVDGPGVTGEVLDNGGNIDSDPLFLDADEGDMRLSADSEAVQSGTNEPYMAEGLTADVTTDAAGNTRISGGTVDIGAYEYQRSTRSSRGRITENNVRKEFEDTGVSLMFTGIPQDVEFDLLVDFLETPPKEVSFTGPPPKIQSDFSWVVTSLGTSFETATLYLHDFELPDSEDPEDLAIYSRPVADIGEFSMLQNTEYDLDLDALKVQLPGFSEFIIASIETDVSAGHADLEIPDQITLAQNYPNPFNPSTNIIFGLPERAEVRLEVFDILGRQVATLVHEEMEPGHHSVVFDAGALSSGMYIYRLQTGSKVLSRKMILLK